jgi:hypothetical protein
LRWVTAPARLIARWRPELAAAIADDDRVFASGRRRSLYVALALVAIGYPLIISVIHAALPSIYRDPSELFLAMHPFIIWTWSESLWFIGALVTIGILSPALAVTAFVIFVPTDLVAANAAQGFQLIPLPDAIFGRLVGDLVLWILIVEIPLRARRWSVASQGRGDWLAARVPPRWREAAVTVALSFFWMRLVPITIQPVMTWAGRQMTPEASLPTWAFWPICTLVIVAAALLRAWLVGSATSATPPAPSTTGRRRLPAIAGDLIRTAGIGLALAGFMPDLADAIVFTTGLVVAIPIANLILPRIPVPDRIATLPGSVRWIAATVVCGLIAELVFQVGFGGGPEFFTLVVVTVILMPVFRVIAEAGRRAAGPPPSVSAPAAATTAIVVAVLLGTGWLGFAAPVSANDCVGVAETSGCLVGAWLAGPLLLLGALLAVATTAAGTVGAMNDDPELDRPPRRPDPGPSPEPAPKGHPWGPEPKPPPWYAGPVDGDDEGPEAPTPREPEGHPWGPEPKPPPWYAGPIDGAER